MPYPISQTPCERRCPTLGRTSATLWPCASHSLRPCARCHARVAARRARPPEASEPQAPAVVKCAKVAGQRPPRSAMKAPDNPLVASCGLEEATQGACHGGAAVGGAGELEQRGALSRGTSFVYAYRKLLCPSGTRERMQKQAMAMQQQGGGVDSGRAHQASAQAGAAPGGGAVPAEAGNPTPAGVPLAPYVAAAEQGGMMGLSVAAAAVSGAPLPVPVSSLATGGFDVLGDAQLPGSQGALLAPPFRSTHLPDLDAFGAPGTYFGVVAPSFCLRRG